MHSSPDAHNAYVRAIDQRLGEKVKPLIRFVKAWKYFNSVPISSFYLELFVATYAAGESSIWYNIDLNSIFRRLYYEHLPSISDPLGISEVIQATSCATDFEEVSKKVLSAHVHAKLAEEAKGENDIPKAFGWWDSLYNGRFPRYS